MLGPLLILLLVLLIAFTLLHEGHESTGVDAGVLCVGMALVLLTAAVLAPRPATGRALASLVLPRAPPRRAAVAVVTALPSSCPIPLRL